MIIDRPDVVAEVRTSFEAYERALLANDVEALDQFFREGDSVVRYGVAENLYGSKAIRAFRAGRLPVGLQRKLERTVIATYGADLAVAATLFRQSEIGKVGRQLQTWVRFSEGWRIVAAHVSVIDNPDGFGQSEAK